MDLSEHKLNVDTAEYFNLYTILDYGNSSGKHTHTAIQINAAKWVENLLASLGIMYDACEIIIQAHRAAMAHTSDVNMPSGG